MYQPVEFAPLQHRRRGRGADDQFSAYLDSLSRVYQERAMQRAVGGAAIPSTPAPRATRIAWGDHWGNRGSHPPEGARNAMRAMRPKLILVMENVHPEAVREWAEAHPDGWIVFRKYYAAPDGGADGASVMNWASGQKEMIAAFRTVPAVDRIVRAGRGVVKAFCEVNFPFEWGRNLPRQEQFRRYNMLFPEAARVIKTSHPEVLMAGPSLAPGNWDVQLPGDPDGLYWIGPHNHIDAALRAMDIFSVHVYPPHDDLTSHWLAWRFWHMWQVLNAKGFKRLSMNTMVLECDAGGGGITQNQRAEDNRVMFQLFNAFDEARASVYGGRVLQAAHWWSRDGDSTWEEDFKTEGSGAFRPVVYVIAETNTGGSAGERWTETTPAPPPTPTPTPPPTPTPTPPPSREWDSRLDELGVKLVPATVTSGSYWRLVSARWEDEKQAQGRHAIFMNMIDEQGNRLPAAQGVALITNGGAARVVLDKPVGEPMGNFPMFAAGNAYSAEVVEPSLPSDKITGMGLGDIARRGQKIHVAYYLTWQRAQAAAPPPPPPNPPQEPEMTFEDTVWEIMARHQLRINPAFALPAAIVAENRRLGDNEKAYHFVTPELRFTYEGKTPFSTTSKRFAMLGAQHPTSEAKIAAVAPEGEWGKVILLRKGLVPGPAPKPPMTWLASPNRHERPAGPIPSIVVWHHTGGGLQGSLDWLRNDDIPIEQRVSAHYVIAKDGRIFQLVGENDVAWHAGYARMPDGRENVNQLSFGIELVNDGNGSDPYPPAQLDAAVALARWLNSKYRIPRSGHVTHRLVRELWNANHPDAPASPKSDPRGLNMDSLLNRVYS